MPARPPLTACLALLPACLLLFTASSAAAGEREDLIAAFNQGDALLKQKNYAAAIPQYQKALALAPRVFPNSTENQATIANSLGICFKNTRQYPQAEKMYLLTLQLDEARVGRNHVSLIGRYRNLALLYQAMGKFDKSEPMFQRVIQLRTTQLGASNATVALDIADLGGNFLSRGQYQQAHQQFEKAYAIQKSIAGIPPTTLADTMHNLATTHVKLGQPTKAEPLLLESIKLREANLGAGHIDLAQSKFSLANVYFHLGQYAKAQGLFEKSLAAYEAKYGANSSEVGAGVNALAVIYQNQRQFTKAIPLYERSLKVRRATLGPNDPQVAETMNNLGTLYSDMGDLAQAAPLLRDSLAIRKKFYGDTHPEIAQSTVNLGLLYLKLNDFKQAETALAENLRIREKTYGSQHVSTAQYGWHNLALARAGLGQYEKAILDFHRARRIFHQHIDLVLPALGEQEQINFLRFRNNELYHTALSLAVRQPNVPQVNDYTAEWVLNGKALTQQALAERAIAARAQGTPDAKALADARTALSAKTLLTPANGTEQALQKEVERLTTRVQELANKVARTIGQALGVGPWVSLPAVRLAIPKDAVLVEIARVSPAIFGVNTSKEQFGADRYVAWIIPPSGAGAVKIVDLGNALKTDKAIEDYQAAMQLAQSPDKQKNPLAVNGEQEAEQMIVQRLGAVADLSLRPLLPHLRDAKQLILSLDDRLWLVPWAALPVETKGGQPTYAVERWQIRYVITGRELIAKRSAAGQADRPHIFANPDYDLRSVASTAGSNSRAAPPANRRSATKLGSVKPLPGTAREAAAIRPSLEKLAGAAPVVLTDKAALEETFKSLRSPKTLVLSTHGFFHEPGANEKNSTRDNPLLRCGLLLAGCNVLAGNAQVDDGVLTGLEILSADLRHTDLVVLSACETGLGSTTAAGDNLTAVTGEGVAGLRQAFQLAGARSVVSTLWQIPDEESAQLMSDFFANLAAGQGKGVALRNAQVAAIKARRERHGAAHPLFWAAFTVTGN